jgi:SAM-dependent methyltransferase
MSNIASNQWYESMFDQPWVDLGDREAAGFRGVLTPLGEIGQQRKGVNAVFLENAEAYYKKYQGFAYWRMLLVQALAHTGVNNAKTVVEFGCGFGNATLPMLDIFPNSRIVASDISPNLLAILEGLLVSCGLKDWRSPWMRTSHIKEESADLIFGVAILHHLVEPGEFIGSALRVLKPGGWAFFFEPLEGGLAVLRLICGEIVREGRRRSLWNRWTRAMRLTENFANDLNPQIFRQATPGWKDRDDKWAFPRSVLDKIARDNEAELRVYGLHDNVGQFRRHFAYMLETYGGMKAAEYPAWAWDIFDRYDNNTFSPEMLLDLALEGCIMFRKKP